MAKSAPRKSKKSGSAATRAVPRSRRPSSVPDEWPAGLRLIVKAAESERPEGHAEALARLIDFALRHVPARGIFDPGTIDDVAFYKEIGEAAKVHLGLNDALAELRSALDEARLSLQRRDPIECAANDVRAVSDTASFYAGLAFGLVFASMSEAVSR